MPTRQLDTLWDNQTPRPSWGGVGRLEYECAQQVLAYRDARDQAMEHQRELLDADGVRRPVFGPAPAPRWPCGEQAGPAMVPRPTVIEAVVVPVSTRGHPMHDVAGREFSRSGLHRGHALAVSLGGINAYENMVPQDGQMNTSQRLFRRKSFDQLGWREVELVAGALAMLGRQNPPAGRPKPSDEISVIRNRGGTTELKLWEPGSAAPRATFAFVYPPIADYTPGGRAIPTQPAFQLQLRLAFRYRQRDRDNWPKSVAVRLSIANGSLLLDREMPWDQPSPADCRASTAIQQGPLLRKRKRDAALADAEEWKAERLRKRPRRPTS